MARENQARPHLRDRLGLWDASRAEALIGIRSQIIPDGAADTDGDPEANLHLSENAGAFVFGGLDLNDEGVPLVERTIKRSPSAAGVVTITLAQAIDGNTSVTLDLGGAGVTLMPIQLADGSYEWLVKNAVGTVTFVP